MPLSWLLRKLSDMPLSAAQGGVRMAQCLLALANLAAPGQHRSLYRPPSYPSKSLRTLQPPTICCRLMCSVKPGCAGIPVD